MTPWNKKIALAEAEHQELVLGDAHWEVIKFARAFYERYGYTPIQRLIVKDMQSRHATFSSVSLNELFPGGPPQICLISGLPKPKRCV